MPANFSGSVERLNLKCRCSSEWELSWARALSWRVCESSRCVSERRRDAAACRRPLLLCWYCVTVWVCAVCLQNKHQNETEPSQKHASHSTHTHSQWPRFVNERIVAHQHKSAHSHTQQCQCALCLSVCVFAYVCELWAGKINETQKRVYAIRTKIFRVATTTAIRL